MSWLWETGAQSKRKNMIDVAQRLEKACEIRQLMTTLVRAEHPKEPMNTACF